MALGKVLMGLRFARELVVVAGELGSALYTAVRGARREEDERAPELVIERERAAGANASATAKKVGKKR